jgi:hypothetical protein
VGAFASCEPSRSASWREHRVAPEMIEVVVNTFEGVEIDHADGAEARRGHFD